MNSLSSFQKSFRFCILFAASVIGALSTDCALAQWRPGDVRPDQPWGCSRAAWCDETVVSHQGSLVYHMKLEELQGGRYLQLGLATEGYDQISSRLVVATAKGLDDGINDGIDKVRTETGAVLNRFTAQVAANEVRLDRMFEWQGVDRARLGMHEAMLNQHERRLGVLEERVGGIERGLAAVGERASAAGALAAAMAGLVAPTRPGEAYWSVGTGGFDGKAALAGRLGYQFQAGAVVQAGFASTNDARYRAWNVAVGGRF